MLTYNQKYSLLSSLSTSTTNQVKDRLKSNLDGSLLLDSLEFVDKVADQFRKRNGYIPDILIRKLNSNTI